MRRAKLPPSRAAGCPQALPGKLQSSQSPSESPWLPLAQPDQAPGKFAPALVEPDGVPWEAAARAAPHAHFLAGVLNRAPLSFGGPRRASQRAAARMFASSWSRSEVAID